MCCLFQALLVSQNRTCQNYYVQGLPFLSNVGLLCRRPPLRHMLYILKELVRRPITVWHLCLSASSQLKTLFVVVGSESLSAVFFSSPPPSQTPVRFGTAKVTTVFTFPKIILNLF